MMETLGSYASSDSSDDEPVSEPPARLSHLLSLASAGLSTSKPSLTTSPSTSLNNNRPTSSKPVHQVSTSQFLSAATPTGHVQITHVHDEVFDKQMHNFSSDGGGIDPGTNAKIRGDGRRKRETAVGIVKKRMRSLDTRDSTNNNEDNDIGRRKRGKPRSKGDLRVTIPTSRLCLSEEYMKDWRGRSWIAPKSGWKTFEEMETYTPYVPKRSTGGFEAHRGGVAAIRLFPKYGHLLLSGGMDNKVKIWDTVSHRKCVRIYEGHGKPVRDIAFNDHGSKFLSASYDHTIKLWDTETGKVLGNYSCDSAIPHCVKFSPGVGQEHEFMIGRSDRKMVQMDIRNAQKPVQEYSDHMGAINSVTFVDENRRIVSSSDDKTLRVWDYGIPVVIKYISDPSLHSMPVVKLHPNQKWMACQSLDNQVLLFSARDRFKLNKKRQFKGHSVSGYACGLTFSADGRFIGSGDGLGRIFFWDWKSSRMLRVLQAHKKVCIGIEWHPTEASKVVTCGWDGYIKYWD